MQQSPNKLTLSLPLDAHKLSTLSGTECVREINGR